MGERRRKTGAGGFPRVRFTVRRLMAGVAALALLLRAAFWVAEMRSRSAAYRVRAFEYAITTAHTGSFVRTGDGRRVDRFADENVRREGEWGRRMAEKYRRLSVYPWMAVGPDPPPPERLAHPRGAFEFPEEDDSPPREGYAPPRPGRSSGRTPGETGRAAAAGATGPPDGR